MKKQKLGNSEIFISPMGLGCWGMSHVYGYADRDESIATIRMAVDMGINLLDTADIYGNGDNEILVGEAIRGIRQNVVISSKFGFTGNEHGALEICGRPDYVKQACDASLKRLRTDFIDIYHLHRVDPKVSIDETVGAMADLIKQGKVKSLGLSEVSAVTLKKALNIHDIASLQSEYSLFTKEMEKEILPACKKAGTGVLAFSPLGRGFLTGKTMNEKQFEQGDYRRNLPRFKGKNLKKNLAIVEKINAFATDKGVTASQLALSWLMHQGPDVFPVPGMKRRKYLQENLDAVNVTLTPEELDFLREVTAGISGSRHNETNLKFIDQ